MSCLVAAILFCLFVCLIVIFFLLVGFFICHEVWNNMGAGEAGSH